MPDLTAWLICLWWAIGPNHHHLTTLAEQADSLEHRLVPISELTESVDPLWVVAHDRSDLPVAFFVRAADWSSSRAFGLSKNTERLLPSLKVPRLFVSEDYLNADGLSGGLRSVEPLAVDQADGLFRVLVEIHIARRLSAEPELGEIVERRAEALMTEVVPEYRRAAYVSALEDFAAHIISIRHEIGRHQRRRPEGTLCALLNHPTTLFGSWHRAVDGGRYPGIQPPAREPSDMTGVGSKGRLLRGKAAPRWRLTRAVLSRADKDWMMTEILKREWTGDPVQDFDFLCAP